MIHRVKRAWQSHVPPSSNALLSFSFLLLLSLLPPWRAGPKYRKITCTMHETHSPRLFTGARDDRAFLISHPSAIKFFASVSLNSVPLDGRESTLLLIYFLSVYFLHSLFLFRVCFVSRKVKINLRRQFLYVRAFTYEILKTQAKYNKLIWNWQF